MSSESHQAHRPREHVEEQLREAILSGEFGEGHKLPTEAEPARRFAVSRAQHRPPRARVGARRVARRDPPPRVGHARRGRADAPPPRASRRRARAEHHREIGGATAARDATAAAEAMAAHLDWLRAHEADGPVASGAAAI